MANAIMIRNRLNAGKSLLAAGLCRIFAQDGYKGCLFKSQNMALNSAITPRRLPRWAGPRWCRPRRRGWPPTCG